MFSPDAIVHGSTALRNPRRRQRTSSDDSLAVRQSTKRRKRSGLATNTFEPPHEPAVNGHAHHANGLAQNGHPLHERKHRDVSVDTTSLAIRKRGGKGGDREKRTNKADEGIVQTKNDIYVVTQDPNIPESLQDIIGTEKWHGQISSSLGYAVALTHKHAIIWHYGKAASATDVSRTYVVTLPKTSSSTADFSQPLPLGILAHDAGVGELALLVVMPSTGEAVYWENVANTANLDPVRQRKQSVQGSVGGLFSGESITKITEAEPDGFVLTFSGGRIAHLTVRDLQGRPKIASQYLRNNSGPMGGILATFKSILNLGRGDIAAVRLGPLQGKNRRSCVVGTKSGIFQVWDLVRHSSKALSFELDIKKDLYNVVTQAGPRRYTEDLLEDFKIVDFTMFPDSEAPENDPGGHRLLVLTALREGRIAQFTLVDLRIRAGSWDIDVIHPITCYSPYPLDDDSANLFKPEVLLPEPAQTAFVFFDTSVVLVSLAKIEESPSSQLQMESHLLPDPFQDVLYLCKEPEYRIVGCTSEIGDDGKAACVFLVHGFGLARVATSPIKNGESATDRTAVTVKTKMEQAVFFGSMPKNLLDFRKGRSEVRFKDEVVEAAALEINDSIMRCTSKYIPEITPSMDYQLKLRANALADLIKYVELSQLKPSSLWQLLWSGEKMAAARAIWQVYNAGLGSRDPHSKSLLPELLDMLSEKYKRENRPDFGETDIVRHYLTYDIWQIELVIPWAQQAIKELYSEGIQDAKRQASLTSEADDIQIHAMEAAFEFRQKNADLYRVGKGMIEDGIYRGSYEGLPEIWTSIAITVVKVKELAELSADTALSGAFSPSSEEGGIELSVVEKLSKDSPHLVHICCQVYEERCRWLKSRLDAKSKADGEALTREYIQIRKELIVKLADLDLAEQGIDLAEKYCDMQALVDVLDRSTDLWNDKLGQALPEEEEDFYTRRLNENKEREGSYFYKYGQAWADAFYMKTVDGGNLTDLLSNPGEFKPFLTRFLRNEPRCMKISWINEVSAEHNYMKASKTLESVYKDETELWNRKIELSMGKLALLAAKEKKQVNDETVAEDLRKFNVRLNAMTIQERLYDYLRPVLRGAIDDAAEAQLAMESFARHFVKGKPTLREELARALKKLLAHKFLSQGEMIDALTLIDEDARVVDEEDFAGQRFFLAFKFMKIINMDKGDPSRYAMYESIVWRRCIIQDDWEALNRTELKNDAAVALATEDTALFKTFKAGFQDGLFDQVPIPSPSSILGTGTSISSLRTSRRYEPQSDAVLQDTANDLELEDQAFEDALEKGRLELRWQGIIDAAKASVRDDADRLGAAMARKEEIKMQLIQAKGLGHRSSDVDQVTHGNGDGHLNGAGNGAAEKDAQGDVIME